MSFSDLARFGDYNRFSVQSTQFCDANKTGPYYLYTCGYREIMIEPV